MKRAAYLLVTAALFCAFAGCKKQETDADAIRDGINQHLAGLKTINLSAMNMNVMSYSVQGNEAQAEVEFRPKAGGPPGAGMQVTYKLEKQNGAWVVQNTQPSGGMIQHPGPGANPNTMPNSSTSSGSSGSMPNFRELVPGGGGGGNGSMKLPPGHPPINAQGNTQAQ
jgi:hypothetical protein